jgi:hypothetical protein
MSDRIGGSRPEVFTFGGMKVFIPALVPVVNALVAHLERELGAEPEVEARAAVEAEIGRLRQRDIGSYVRWLCTGMATTLLEPIAEPDLVAVVFAPLLASVPPSATRAEQTRTVAAQIWRHLVAGEWVLTVMDGHAGIVPAPARATRQ